jgi:hypothetical protein
VIINQTYKLVENLTDWFKEKLPLLAQQLVEESPDNILPEYKDYKAGFVDVLNLKTYPTLVIGIGERKPEEMFTNIYSFDIVSVNKSSSKEQSVKDGYLLSDALTYLIKNNPRLDGLALDSAFQTVEYFQTDSMFVSAISLLVEVEEGEI